MRVLTVMAGSHGDVALFTAPGCGYSRPDITSPWPRTSSSPTSSASGSAQRPS
jgi:hypothetical protein